MNVDTIKKEKQNILYLKGEKSIGIEQSKHRIHMYRIIAYSILTL